MTRQGAPDLHDWMADLADAFPDEAWLQKVDPAPDFDDEPWHGLYWRAWEALRFDRPYGAMGGEGFITYATYRMYAKDNGIEGEDFDLFLTFMGQIDAEWIRLQDEKAKAKAPNDS